MKRRHRFLLERLETLSTIPVTALHGRRYVTVSPVPTGWEVQRTSRGASHARGDFTTSTFSEALKYWNQYLSGLAGWESEANLVTTSLRV